MQFTILTVLFAAAKVCAEKRKDRWARALIVVTGAYAVGLAWIAFN